MFFLFFFSVASLLCLSACLCFFSMSVLLIILLDLNNLNACLYVRIYAGKSLKTLQNLRAKFNELNEFSQT